MTVGLDAAALAAVDLGSNSFHMIVAREEEGRPRVVDRIRDRVALAEGLSEKGRLDPLAEARALTTLERFAERIRAVPRGRVRAVGTATFRRLRDGGAFLRRASDTLGVTIETLPGREEARLVYLGVAHSLGDDDAPRLVVDIGGGSTELILGRSFAPSRGDSISMGCVTWTRRYFEDGRATRESMAAAQLAGRVELEPVADAYGAEHWEQAIGSSGTIKSIAAIVREQGWSDGAITRDALDRLTAAVVDAKRFDELELAGLRADRRPVLAGGVAVLQACFESLGIEAMRASEGALREGLLHDLLGRVHQEDVREEGLRAFGERFGADLMLGRRARRTAEALFDQVAASLGLDAHDRQLLGWAALVHGVGLAVSQSGYHRHGAYLIEHADLVGFSRQDRDELARLVRGQRRKIEPELLAALAPDRAAALRRLLPILRVALRLHRARVAVDVPIPRASAEGDRLELAFEGGWLEARPLTRRDLEGEVRRLTALGIDLAWS